MAGVPTRGLFQWPDNAGAPLAGGSLAYYEAGTSTPRDTFSDAALTTPNANPVVLDSAGRATIYVTKGVGYKIVAKDADGNTLWTLDDYIEQDDPAAPADPTVIVVHSDVTETAGTSSPGEDILAQYTLPGGTLDGNGDAVEIVGHVDLAANANNKRARLYFGSTVIGDSDPNVTTEQTSVTFIARVARVDATHQIAYCMVTCPDVAVPTWSVITAPGEALAGDVVIKVTGGEAAVTNGADVTGQWLQVRTEKP